MRQGTGRPLPIAILATLTLVLTVVAAGEGVLPGDIAIARAVQRLDFAAADAVQAAGYWLGSLWPIVIAGGLVAIALALAGYYGEAVVMLAIVAARALNPLLKWLIASPRPAEEDVRVTEFATNYGYPSGHVMGAVLIYGGAFVVAVTTIQRLWLRRLVQTLCMAVILIVCFGRIHSGAHWPSDVLGGILWGSLILSLLIPLGAQINRRLPLPSAAGAPPREGANRAVRRRSARDAGRQFPAASGGRRRRRAR